MSTMLGSADVKRLGSTLSGLLSFSDFDDAEAWRRKAACSLRDLVEADAAYLSLESPATTSTSLGLPASVVDAYRRYYARVDHGIARQRALRLAVWSRRMLWNDQELATSEYYNDFAVPNRLRYAMGVAAKVPAGSVRVSLLYASPARPAGGAILPALRGLGGRLRLLRLALPAFRVGAMLSLRRQSRDEGITEVMDRVTQPLALYSASGRLLHENAALAHAAAPHDAALRESIERVASTVASQGRAARLHPRGTSATAAGWRIVGSCIDGAGPDGAGPAVLVSLEPGTTPTLPADVLRQRYALTAREVQVLELLRTRHSNAEIADRLGISLHTARHHTEHVLLKLGLTSRRHVVDRFTRLVDEAAAVLAPRSPSLALGVP